MGILDFLSRSRSQRAAAPPVGAPRAQAGQSFAGLDDPTLREYLRAGGIETASGAAVSVEAAMRNTSVLRSVTLISRTIGMLPFHLIEKGDERRRATEHPLFEVLHVQPNGWQTALDFRSLLQAWALIYGDGFAYVVRVGGEVRQLIPMHPARVEVKQADDWRVRYVWHRENGGTRTFEANDVFHLRGPSLDGLRGLSTVRQAAEAIGLSLQAEKAAARLFRNGMLIGGALMMPEGVRLSPEALDRLRSSMEERFEDAENAGRWMILEEGMKAEALASSAKDSQHLETRRHQIEEVARAFGVPRPFLMVDETSWGTGIEMLGQALVRYCLSSWFTAWEQATTLRLLRPDERSRYHAKFNAGALERGNLKDQADFFAKALGSGGHMPWMHPDEVRDLMDMGTRDDLPAAPGQQATEGEQR